MLIGPRQCGKTTLVRQLDNKTREYVTLDDDTVLEAARSDPAGFVRGFDRVPINEVQRAPELLRAIKQSVDSDRRAGRFLLTGSANILTLPQVSESLAGRMETVNLLVTSSRLAW
jgi:predicted AAA+ superfamily ATPase